MDCQDLLETECVRTEILLFAISAPTQRHGALHVSLWGLWSVAQGVSRGLSYQVRGSYPTLTAWVAPGCTGPADRGALHLAASTQAKPPFES